VSLLSNAMWGEIVHHLNRCLAGLGERR